MKNVSLVGHFCLLCLAGRSKDNSSSSLTVLYMQLISCM